MFEIYNKISQDFQLLLTFLMSIVGTVFLSIFSIIAITNAEYVLASYLLIPLFAGISNIALLNSKYKKISTYNLSVICGFIIFMLIAHGGTEKTGILWTYSLLTIAVSILSFKLGVLFCLLFISFTTFIMFVPHNIDFVISYSMNEATRYLSSSLALCVLTLTFVRIQEKTKRDLQERSITDELTGLYNRSVVNEKRRIKYGTEESSLLLIDIDYFKQVNDEFGHHGGDKVLVIVSKIIKSEVREEDLAIRWGGEEFLVILKDCPQKGAVGKATAITEKVRHNKELRKMLNKELTLSIGVSTIDDNANLFESIKIADRHLYQAKNTGRDRIIDDVSY